jgi:hypothetical protein
MLFSFEFFLFVCWLSVHTSSVHELILQTALKNLADEFYYICQVCVCVCARARALACVSVCV